MPEESEGLHAFFYKNWNGKSGTGRLCELAGIGERETLSLDRAERWLMGRPLLRPPGRGWIMKRVDGVSAPLGSCRNRCATAGSLVDEENAGQTKHLPST